MASFALVLISASVVGILLWKIVQYLQVLNLTKRFHSPGLHLPFLGHSLHLLKSPENIWPMLVDFSLKDPERRKFYISIGLGHHQFWLCHPELTEKILNSNVNINKSFDYNFLLPWLGRGLLINSGQAWRNRRKVLTPAFHFKILDDAIHTFNNSADTLVDILLQDGKSGEKVLDFFPYLIRCTLDIILESAMGKKLHLQENKDSPYAKSTAEMVSIIQFRQKSPWLWPDWIFPLSTLGINHDFHLKVLHGFTKKVIQERRDETSNANKSKRLAFLDLLLNIQTVDGKGLSDKEIQEEVDTFMFEGHDTTACALTWSLLLIANHPEVQEKILEEQIEIFGDDIMADVEQEHLNKMKYLEACVKEALRLYPSVPFFGRIVDEDFYVDGQLIPKGMTVVVFTMLQHRNPKVWDNPNEFIPERFLSANNRDKSQHPYAYIPFSAGARNCIGMKFALMEEKTVLSKLFRRIKVVRHDRIEDVKPVVELITRPQNGIRATFHERNFEN